MFRSTFTHLVATYRGTLRFFINGYSCCQSILPVGRCDSLFCINSSAGCTKQNSTVLLQERGIWVWGNNWNYFVHFRV